MNDATRQRFDANVLARLRVLGRRMRVYVALDGLAIIAIALLAGIAITCAVDRSLWLTRQMRAVQLVSLLTLGAGITWWRLLRPLRVPVRLDDLALLIERRWPQLRSRLISAVEFARSTPPSQPDAAPTSRRGAPTSSLWDRLPAGQSDRLEAGPTTNSSEPHRSAALMEAVIAQAERESATLPFEQTLNSRRAARAGVVTAACLLILTAAAIAAPHTMSLWLQRNVLLRDPEWPQRNRLAIEGLTGGKLVVPRGDDVTVSAVVEPGYEPPRQVYMSFQGEGGARGREQMPAIETPGGPDRFTYTFERLAESMQCRVTGGDAQPLTFAIEAVDRPRVADVTVGITPPAYTHGEPYELRAGQTVAEALKGSRIRIRVHTNKPLTSAVLVRDTGGREQEVGPAQRLSDLEYVADDAPDATATYYFRMLDALGLSNISERQPPVRVAVRLVVDKPPKVKTRIRGAGEMITPQAVLPVEMEFANTYGLASARLVYDVSRKDFKPTPERIPGFEPGTKTFAHAVEWSAATHNLAEGERLTLHAEATDFDNISGPNTGQSPPIIMRVVSRDELLSELNRREQEYRQDFERLLRQQEELYSELLSLANLPPASAQDRARRSGQLARLQRDYAGRVNSTRMQFEQVLSELRVNQLSTPGTESRLQGGIVDPLDALIRVRMAAGVEELEKLARAQANGPAGLSEPRAQASGPTAAYEAQRAIIGEMQRILARMIKWEGFQEAVSLLREVMKMQGQLSEETEKRIEAEVFGAESQPAGK
jgi:hypothetical protein